MTAPVFSIIIPTFNCVDTLANSVQSIASQTYSSFEIIIQDGGSTDGTTELITTLQGNNASIKAFTEKDQGIYDAMNKAIYRANGTWLYFLGSDDRLYDTTVLENIHAVTVAAPHVQVVYGNVWSERFKGTYDGAFNFKKILHKNVSHQAIFFHKSVFPKTGLFNLKYKAQADWDHNLKWILSPGIEILFVNRTIAHYADGGFSSQHGDDSFYRDLRLNYLRYGRESLPLGQKIFVYVYEFLKLAKRGDRRRIGHLWELLTEKKS